MSTATSPAAFPPLTELPRARASDLKKLGWRAIMDAVRSQGKLSVTNHDRPEAVILPVAEYDAIRQIVERADAQNEAALASLRRSFDERLAVLQEGSAAERLRSSFGKPARLHGRIKAGPTY
jgi:prevent-host-death family protein